MITCLSDLFSDKGLLRTVDGLVVNRQGILCCEAELDVEILRMYFDVASRLGVELAGMDLPLTGTKREDALVIALDRDLPDGVCRICLQDGGAAVKGSSLENLERGVLYLCGCYPFDGNGKTLREQMELSGMDCITALTVDTERLCVSVLEGRRNGSRIAAQTVFDPKAGAAAAEDGSCWGHGRSYENARKHFKQHLDVRMVASRFAAAHAEAALCVAVRMAMENYETVLPYGVSEIQPGCCNVRFVLEEGKPYMARDDKGMTVCGQGASLLKLAYAYAAEEEDVFDTLLVRDVEEILSCGNEVGQALECLCRVPKSPAQKTLISREYTRAMVSREGLQDFLTKKMGNTVLRNFNDGKELYRDSFSRSWEGDDLLALFREKVLPQVKEGDRVRISGRLSEDAGTRRGLEAKLAEELAQAGADAETEILCSFKSGYSWIEERVIPALQAKGGAEKTAAVVIRFPYLLNERGDDTFEDESTPNYGVHQDDPQKFFDIPTRWLQELFPVDELLAERLHLSVDAVTFVREDDLGATYQIDCIGEDGTVLHTDRFDVKYVEKKYMEKYPQIGKTHVTTGWLNAEINGETVLDERVVTDPEKVWSVLEYEIIPKLETYVTCRYGLEGLVEAQPLFHRLQINIQMSEPDRDLGYRQERISTAEAMQEDIYFYLLDWFKTYGERECGKELDNVGLIMPEPEIRCGAETDIEVILYDDLAEGAQLCQNSIVEPIPEKEIQLQVERVSFENGVLCQYVSCKDADCGKKLVLLHEMVAEGIVDFYQHRPVTLCLAGGSRLVIPAHERTPSVLSEDEKNRLLDNRVIDYEQYLELLRYYEGEAHVRLMPVETTYKGKKIFYLECIRREEGICYSANKLKSERISAAFTARHHGNESSSLNGTFRLLERLLSDRNKAMEKMNTVLVPFINIDGGTLHCQVQKKHPKWLCHPARYNSAGYEFRKDFENPDSKYGEARMLEKLWKQYLFDVITDNHGFEGHELCQPFSGYISPWYKSFWIPRAFYYGYIWYNGDLPHMEELGKRVRQRVCDVINGDEEIRSLNLVFAERFYKYAEKWFPDLFKLDRFDDVVFYWIDTRVKPRAANYGIRNPEITALDWTTELADETAVDSYMETNVRGHHLSDLALLDVLEDCPLHTDYAARKENGIWVCSRFRRHPLFAEA